MPPIFSSTENTTIPPFIQNRDYLKIACEWFEANSEIELSDFLHLGAGDNDQKKQRYTIAAICNELKRAFEKETSMQEEIQQLWNRVAKLEKKQDEKAIEQLGVISTKEDEQIQWRNETISILNELKESLERKLDHILSEETVPKILDLPAPQDNLTYKALSSASSQIYHHIFQLLNRTIGAIEHHKKAINHFTQNFTQQLSNINSSLSQLFSNQNSIQKRIEDNTRKIEQLEEELKKTGSMSRTGMNLGKRQDGKIHSDIAHHNRTNQYLTDQLNDIQSKVLNFTSWQRTLEHHLQDLKNKSDTQTQRLDLIENSTLLTIKNTLIDLTQRMNQSEALYSSLANWTERLQEQPNSNSSAVSRELDAMKSKIDSFSNVTDRLANDVKGVQRNSLSLAMHLNSTTEASNRNAYASSLRNDFSKLESACREYMDQFSSLLNRTEILGNQYHNLSQRVFENTNAIRNLTRRVDRNEQRLDRQDEVNRRTCLERNALLMELRIQFPEEHYPIHAKVREGNLTILVRYLNSSCANPNLQEDHQRTLLREASEVGWKQGISLLLESGADPNLGDQGNVTPLHAAAMRNDTKTVKYSLDKYRQLNISVDLDIADWNNATALYTAADRGFTNIVDALAKAGANVNAAIKYGDTPLHTVIHNCYSDTYDVLILYKPDFWIRNSKGRFSVFISTKAPGATACMEIECKLIKTCQEQFQYWFNISYDSHVTGYSGRQLCWNTLKEKIHNAKSALAAIPCNETRDFLFSLKNTMGYYPIHRAAETGDIDTVNQYLETGCSDVNWQDSTEDTLMHRAVLGNQPDIVQLLYGNGADLSLTNNAGYTAIHLVVNKKDLRSVQQITNWADLDSEVIRAVNIESYRVPTALYMASNSGDFAMVEALITAEANASQCVQQVDWCPLHSALQRCDDKVVSALLKSNTSLLSMLTRDRIRNTLPIEIMYIEPACNSSVYSIVKNWCLENLDRFGFKEEDSARNCADLIDQHRDTLRTQYFTRQSSQRNQTRSKRSLPDSIPSSRAASHIENATVPVVTNRSIFSNKTDLEMILDDLQAKSSSLFNQSQPMLFPSIFGFANGFADRSMDLYISTNVSPNQRLGILLAVHVGLKGIAYRANAMDATGLAAASFLMVLRDGLSVKATWVQTQWGEAAFHGVKWALWLAEQISLYSLTTLLTITIPALYEAETFNERWNILQSFAVFQIAIPLLLHQTGYILGEMSAQISAPTVTNALKTAANMVFSNRFFNCMERNMPACMRNRCFSSKKAAFEMKEPRPSEQGTVSKWAYATTSA